MKNSRRRGDRRDGKLIRDLDPLHYVTGIIYPNRCDNEAYISERIDLTAVNQYLERKNAAGPAYKYNLFQLIVTALAKTITLRPKLNRFIVNGKFYQRNEVSASFVVKREFSDKGEEALAFYHAKDGDTLEDVHDDIYRQVSVFRGSDYVDPSSNAMDIFNKMPMWLSRTLLKTVMVLDRHGKVPNFLIETDPYYSSCVLSNVGSIKLKSGYHHLVNWGTCSLFCLIGEIKDRPKYAEDGSYTMVPTVDLGLTIDERLADGYYYSKSVKLLQFLLTHPDLLEKPLNAKVDFDRENLEPAPAAPSIPVRTEEL